MAVYLLDTTTLTLLQRNHLQVSNAFARHSGNTIGLTSVNIEEVIGGWFALLRKVKNNSHEARTSQSLAEAMAFLANFPIFPVTEPALDRFDHLLRLKLNVGKMDLKIAAIALEQNATVVSNNVRDFRRIPGLLLEDWSI
jgi:tRNA(fMet)-specific endonuclease VapC